MGKHKLCVCVSLQVEHQKLKSYHFATDRELERTEWVDALTQAATLQTDPSDNARFIIDPSISY